MVASNCLVQLAVLVLDVAATPTATPTVVPTVTGGVADRGARKAVCSPRGDSHVVAGADIVTGR
jgi:hypothetical protein